MNYLNWDEKTITDFSESNIAEMYDRGYVFTRVGKGVMHQTRSVRIDLSKFSLTSENRRILKKVGNITLYPSIVPMKTYDWTIGKLAKDFYDKKFGPGIMSVQKIKEMLFDSNKSNFNCLLMYSNGATSNDSQSASEPNVPSPIGYAICYSSPSILHYSYPFYDLNDSPADMGLGMMIKAIEHAKNSGMKYIYLGSLQRPTDTYKLQFEGLEWFDGGAEGTQKWSTDLDTVKNILSSAKMS